LPNIIITSRWNSTRIPGKALVDIECEPLLWRCVTNCRNTGFETIVATTYDSLPIIQMCETSGVPYCCVENEDDVLGRLVKAVDIYPCNEVIRVWGDSPLISPFHIMQSFIQASNTRVEYSAFKDLTGEVVTICKSNLYLELDKTLTEPKDREWIHKYIMDNRKVSKFGFWESQVVDTPEDLERVRAIVRKSKS